MFLVMSSDFISVLRSLSSWIYRVANIPVPGLGVSFWLLGVSLFTLSFVLRIFGLFNHSPQNENNNNAIYRGDSHD